jgi:cyclase
MNVRVIPRLDIKGPNVIKGLSFDGYRALGSPAYLARRYYEEGADELIYHDAVASLYQRNGLEEIVRQTAKAIFIPLTVAGGLRTVDDIRTILRAGADKVAINTAAIANPDLIRQASMAFGSQCIVVSIEAMRRVDGSYEAFVDYGRQPTGLDVVEWAHRAVELGAGEVLLTSVANDGLGLGYEVDLVRRLSNDLPVPVIACGGAGSIDDVVQVATVGRADAVAAASIFHYHYLQPPNELEIPLEQEGLRMGKHIDVGNWDYAKTRLCHGLPWEMIEPVSIPEVKAKLAGASVEVRTGAHQAVGRGVA